MFNAPVVAVGKFFVKRHALAIGISFSGCGFGTFALPPLIEYLISQYSWRGAMMIWAVIVLNGVPMGLLLEPRFVIKAVSSESQESDCNIAEGGAPTFDKDITKQKAATGHENTDAERNIFCCGFLPNCNINLLKSPSFLSFAIFNCLCFFGEAVISPSCPKQHCT